MCLNIHNNALFVADAHDNKERISFYTFLKALEKGDIKTTQLFLMGDMFDFITQESFYFIEQNQQLLDLINALSKQIEIVYLEGNHDYNLKMLFPDVLVIPREQQPLKARYNSKKVALSHGDNFTPWSYNVYCAIIRNKPLLKCLNAIDFNHWLSKRIEKALSAKTICKPFKTFKQLVKKRIAYYDCDMMVEGHFHQGGVYEFDNKTYVNIPSLYCHKAYVKLCDDAFLTLELRQNK
jgi:UDP-2,3-diacylglucosamine hydrolase